MKAHWQLLILATLFFLLEFGVYKVGYYQGFDDGSQFVIDEIKKHIDEHRQQPPALKNEKEKNVLTVEYRPVQDGVYYSKYWANKVIIKNCLTKEITTVACNPKIAVWFETERITVYNREKWVFEVVSSGGKYESLTEENISFFVRDTREEATTTLKVGKVWAKDEWIMVMEILHVRSQGAYYDVLYVFD
jgi:hypothetical protein